MENVSPDTGYICRSAHYIPGKVAPACQKDTAFPVFLSRTSSSSCRYLSIPDAACQEYLYTQPLSVLLCLHPIPGTGMLIIALLIGYNTVLTLRDKDDQIAKLTADLESANLYKQSDMQSQEDAAGSSYEDGIWKGEAQGFGGAIQVEVTVEGGSITDISIVSAEKEDGAYLSMAKDIIPAIIDAQSAEVDTISGATFSSTGIKNAVAQALEEAAN